MCVSTIESFVFIFLIVYRLVLLTVSLVIYTIGVQVSRSRREVASMIIISGWEPHSVQQKPSV